MGGYLGGGGSRPHSQLPSTPMHNGPCYWWQVTRGT
ncbi:predicted protein [Chaetomium globosum CBS 148.51]|uniref:Uncharacterized protein n=1 Tax=Chaetomium globosum (strain ATCC 6205 / CBS 148.51 / DSM 1962 / NBRC 6347 / NRRL 1970) TaxID=306901 RepID=Q2HAT4_CHAGB|nr:uncharacterized protein CHGG_02670 [Chaetomium globosum CBS 148.51]EAQ90735.1 predicted protein [Chaetomium globosum CBS 148.51]